MRFETHGRTDAAAETVILSAGLGGAAAYWRPQMAALAERFRVLTYDQRGTGQNAEPLPDPYAIGSMADDLLEIAEAAGAGRVHLVGHALGGLAALDFAHRFPERTGRVAVVNGWARADAHTRRCFTARTTLLRHAGPEAYVAAQPIFLYPAAWLSANAAAVEAEVAHGLAHFQGEANLLRRIDALLRFDATEALPSIHAPALLVAAHDDVLVPWTASRALAEALPDARLAAMDTGAHACNVVEPDRFNALLLPFLEGSEPA
ncbi:pyrimidine utilization protein D [Roseomonas elaeocarpi]|uniref:Putative carbamate hydrolase RutD n=1 Tax=Roseomonas elaeocarpi TaxID=907779 RepID=A0ABV6JSZ1_9PROT